MPSLRLATDDEKRSRDALTWPEWGQRLTQPQFLMREAQLRAHPFSAAGMRTWLWCEGPSVLASCETFACRARLGAREGHAQAVASVFTEVSSRRRGYATALLDAVTEVVEAESGHLATVLFSDVGERQYARSGFASVPGVDCVLAPSATVPSGVRWLDAHVDAPWPALSEARLCLAPTASQLDWHAERERFYRRCWSRAPLVARGAVFEGSSLQWAAFDKADELVLLWLHAEAEAHVPPLLEAARWVAWQAGLKAVRAWTLPGSGSLAGATVEERSGSLAMVRPACRWDQVQRGLWV